MKLSEVQYPEVGYLIQSLIYQHQVKIRMEESFVALIKLLAKILASYNSESGIRTRIVWAWSNSAIHIAFHSSNVMPQIAGRKILVPEEDNYRLMCEMFFIFAIF